MAWARWHFLFGLALWMVAGALSPAPALPPRGTCFALVPDGGGGRPVFRCAGAPAPDPGRILILRLPLPGVARRRNEALVVNFTRFRRMTARFVYADGTADTQRVAAGAYGAFWHVGGQIAFPARRSATLVAAWLAIDGLERYDLLRLRFVPRDRLARQFEICAVLIGAALGLLGLAAAFNLCVGLALRRRFFLWHGLWAATVFVWGIVWSQCVLALVPGLAGTTCARAATILASLALLFASLSARSALGGVLPGAACRLIGVLGGATALVGVLASLPGAPLPVLAPLLAAATLLTLAAVAGGVGWAWRRGHGEARDLAAAWAIPMLTLGATQLVDFDTALFGGGAQIAVLFASALQTICLSLLASVRLNKLRLERDVAVATGARLAELAYQDSLTGLLNRRGFALRCEQVFGGRPGASFALLLIDVDQFKSLNDVFGHETGDAVLVRLAEALRALERRHGCVAGRLGGEEFVIGTSGLAPAALLPFADGIRVELGGCDHGEVSLHRAVTVSIGVAEGVADGPLGALYGRADQALYRAKRAGRDRAMLYREPAAAAFPDAEEGLRPAG